MTFILTVKVTPNASKNQIVGWEEDYLRVRIRGIPEKGQVNKELISSLAEVLGIAKSQVELISGHTSRIKRLKIEGAALSELLSKNLDQ